MAFVGWEAFDMEGVGSVLSDLATIRDKAGNLLVFAIGADKAVWLLSLQPHAGPKGKSAWKWGSLLKPDAHTSLVPISTTKGLAVAQNADGRLEIFALGTNGSLYHKWQTAVGGPWSAWKIFPELFDNGMVDLRVSQNHNGGLDVFVRIADNHDLWHIWQTTPDTWSEWTVLASPTDTEPYQDMPPNMPPIKTRLQRSSSHGMLQEFRRYSRPLTTTGPTQALKVRSSLSGAPKARRIAPLGEPGHG